MKIKIVHFINHYQAKWFCADFLFIFDTLANGIWGSKYYDVFTAFGFKASTINTAISLLELIRLSVLLYQRGIQRETEGIEPRSLKDKKHRSKDK